MSFFLETTDMDLGDTPIENIFINDYMPMANGTYVKVYLIGYKYAHDRDFKIEVNNETIAKHLNIPLEDVLRAWDFWQGKGIIEKIPLDDERSINYKVRFLNLKQLYIKNNIQMFMSEKEEIKPSRNATEELVQANKVPEINHMFNSIDHIMRRQTVPMEKQKILSWITDFNMNPDVIERAFSYGVERKGIRKLSYIEGIIRNWYDDGLTHMDAIMENIKTQDERYYLYQKIMKSLGLDKRPAREDEIGMMDKWLDEYKFNMDIILRACGMDKNPTPSINYVNAILKSWNDKGVKELADIELLDKQIDKPDRSKKSSIKKAKPTTTTRFHNFEQRTDKYSSDDLEKMARRKREAYSQRIKGE